MNASHPIRRMLMRTFHQLGEPGTYRRADGVEIETRFIAKSPDVVASFGDTRLVMATHRFDVLRQSVPEPREGDRFTLGGQVWHVVGEPLADRDRLIWTLTGAPL